MGLASCALKFNSACVTRVPGGSVAEPVLLLSKHPEAFSL
nr:MAG TPA: hypothetical protein [Caudoviricetes sp.]